ncbi:amidase [Massilia sp. TS11]|uniref:amidase n=1 Tax=Massilia sp. TS11 TaxID=2908003 RepID=UPI001EDB89DB|nr:amidase [Massilia sp. TS11]MCG2583336.1 amidase [Massilia sp. TS11]
MSLDRRSFLTSAAVALSALPAQAKGFDIAERSATELQALLASGKQSSLSLTRQYLERIRRIDQAGPKINSVIEINPDALAIAAELDRERKLKGPRGPLHGLPVLIKDNIATQDKMQTTAGSLALLGARAPRDAHIVQRLRAAGAVILGKTNLSEWANIRSSRSTSGWSARGGQTRNPYALDRNTSGSSAGTGAAIAASLAALGVGTETDGSIVSPASRCGLVGFKPTLGLVSRDGIVPIAHSQDTAGPMTRNVADAALLLSVLAGPDTRDAITVDGARQIGDYLRALDPQGLRGARLGYVKNARVSNRRVWEQIDAAVAILKAQGATVVEVDLPNADKYGASELEVLLTELKADLNAYLAEFGQGAPVRNLAELIAFNEAHKDKEMPYFDQELLIRAQEKGGLDSQVYRDALANNRRYAGAEGIDKVLDENKLDALVAPSGGPAWLIDPINGDQSTGGFSGPAAVAGYPHITVPAAYLGGLPIGLSFVGRAFADAQLLRYAYAFEQASRARRAPAYRKSVGDGL